MVQETPSQRPTQSDRSPEARIVSELEEPVPNGRARGLRSGCFGIRAVLKP
jgi:hypothetical protein